MTLSKPDDDLDFGTSIEETEDFRMKIALMIGDNLEGGAAQEELLQRAITQAVQLPNGVHGCSRMTVSSRYLESMG
ncbi:unnamed protein product [Phytophthora lilii]|uniref:Unnamed protein product n=1 Tax=Phytophthora lilii TaxID=2077276 RepID=A0A9W6XGT0_9STRA|nr:unnamed protein product [Phytophthora lilii]